jgi:hypothetical protein
MSDHLLQAKTQRSTTAADFPQPISSLVPCIYLALQCPRCGDVRQAISQLPSSAVIFCPGCATACDFVVLATGFTTRRLPFSEVRRSDARLLACRDELPSVDPPSLNLSG